MNDELQILNKDNYWTNEKIETGYFRDSYIGKLSRFLGNKLVKVILGQRLISLRIACMVVLLAVVMPGEIGAAQAPEPAEFVDEITDALSFAGEFEISTETGKENGNYNFLSKGLKDMWLYRLKSKKPLSGGSTYLRPRVYIMEYEDAASAKAVFEGLLAVSDPNIGLSYAWDYVARVGKRLYRLNVPCILSELNWRLMVVRVELYLKKNAEDSDSFECRCGLNCRREWKD